MLDLADTIAAIASAAGGATRGIVRLSGPDVVACVGPLFSQPHTAASSHEPRLALDRPRRYSGWLTLDEPLGEVIATVNRYAPRQIIIEDPGIRELSFTGTARIDRIDDWVRALPHAFPVTVAELDEGRQLIGPRPGSAPD